MHRRFHVGYGQELRPLFIFSMSVLMFSGLVDAAGAQSEITRGVIASGGGDVVSGSPTHQIRFTLGQPFAGVVASGSMEIRSGFWHRGVPVTVSVPGIEVPGSSGSPKAFRLYQSYPNPGNSLVTFVIDVPVQSKGLFEIYDAAGRRVKTLVNGNIDPGKHRFEWDGRNENGELVPAGVYLYKLVTPEYSATSRLIWLR